MNTASDMFMWMPQTTLSIDGEDLQPWEILFLTSSSSHLFSFSKLKSGTIKYLELQIIESGMSWIGIWTHLLSVHILCAFLQFFS
jgi:hypothetical protein